MAFILCDKIIIVHREITGMFTLTRSSLFNVDRFTRANEMPAFRAVRVWERKSRKVTHTNLQIYIVNYTWREGNRSWQNSFWYGPQLMVENNLSWSFCSKVDGGIKHKVSSPKPEISKSTWKREGNRVIGLAKKKETGGGWKHKQQRYCCLLSILSA